MASANRCWEAFLAREVRKSAESWMASSSPHHQTWELGLEPYQSCPTSQQASFAQGFLRRAPPPPKYLPPSPLHEWVQQFSGGGGSSDGTTLGGHHVAG